MTRAERRHSFFKNRKHWARILTSMQGSEKSPLDTRDINRYSEGYEPRQTIAGRRDLKYWAKKIYRQITRFGKPDQL